MSEKVLDALVDLVNFRIAAAGKQARKDENGNVVYTEENIFERSDIEHALNLSLTAFNMAVYPTYFKMDEEEIIMQMSDLLVTYACHTLLLRQSLLEKGREFTVTDNGVEFTPPYLAEFVYRASRDLRADWLDGVTVLKSNDTFWNDFVREPDESDGE